MGDRANIHTTEDGKNGIYFYSHWSGSNLPVTLQAALKRGKDRWDDAQYLNRIIFCEMIQNDVLGLTGAGISTEMGDNTVGRPVIEVDIDKKTVTIEKVWTFEEYIKADLSELDF